MSDQREQAAADVVAADQESVSILVVDDDHGMLRAVKTILAREGYRVLAADGVEQAQIYLLETQPDAVMLDIQMPGVSGLDFLPVLKREHENLPVVMMTAYATVETAVRAVKEGAYDFLTKPFENIDQVVNVIRKAVQHKQLLDRARFLEDALDNRERYEDLVGGSAKMKEVFELVESVSYSTATVLIQGESGTGKELVARATHYRSPRRDRPFVAVNCSALTETLLESELFGHAKGSFTGAIAEKKGLFEAASGGTIFLDEIGDIPPSMQVKLLRVLQEGEVKRVGANDTRMVDVRVIAATNKDLQTLMKEGTFREDLYYRLNVITVVLPPLRERADDVPALAYHFLQRYTEKLDKKVTGLEPDMLEILQVYAWPGNVRELENVVERAVVLARGETLHIRDLPPHLREGTFSTNAAMDDFGNLSFNAAKKLSVQAFERRYLKQVLVRTDGNISKASREAGLDRSNFRRILKKHDLDSGDLS
jgi:DNA-binding NtrC family response regulator